MCSCGARVEFFWIGCVDRKHLDAAVQALMTALSGGTRVRNPYGRAAIEAMFRRRLQLATKGELVPSDHVKRIEGQPWADMFEVRWDDINVTERDPGGGLSHGKASARLYYVEIGGLKIIGVHAHEKDLRGDARSIRAAQDAQIDLAVAAYVNGLPTRWGVPELVV